MKAVSVGRWPPSWFHRDWFWGLILVGAVIMVYQPVWHAGFVWDDDGYIAQNPCVGGFWHGLKAIWTTSIADISPLAITTFGLEYMLWGLAPLPYHLVNVLMHGACAVLLWRVLRSLQIPGAWLGAALWALHPVQVESVAWISEMKNTESGLFFLLSILFFVRWLKTGENKKGSDWNYILTLVFAALAMASKSSTVVLPIALGLCAWWVEGRWQWRNLVRVGPIFLLSIATSAVSIWTQGLHLGEANPEETRTWPERLVMAGDAVWFYVGKLLWPHPLITHYPRWNVDAWREFSCLPLLAVIIVLLILWSKRRGWARPYFFAWAYFLTALLPVLGLIDNPIFHFSLVFDHLQYLADMGPLALAGAGMVRLADFAIPGRLELRSCLCAGVLLVLGMASWQRAWVYRNSETLWTDTLAKNPNSWVGHNNLGVAFYQKGQIDEAIIEYQKALKINSNYAEAHNNIGNTFLRKGRIDEAIIQYQKALAINPDYADADADLGVAFSHEGRIDEAIAEYQKALAINPNYAEAHNNIGNTLLRKGRIDEAISEYQKALEINPNLTYASNGLEAAFAKKEQMNEAMDQYQKTLKIDPNYAEAHNNLGRTLARKGQLDEAMAEYQEALEINPNYAEAHDNLGNALYQKGQIDEAMVQYQKALAINPNYAEARNNVGNTLLRKGRLDEAIIQYQKALEINPNFAEAHDNLGLALSRKGRLDEAMAQFQKALEINPNLIDAQNNMTKAQAMAGQSAQPPAR